MDSFQLYSDMKARTNGEIYIGVVGPVRTGKSTFIKRFMDLLVLPNMTDEHARERTQAVSYTHLDVYKRQVASLTESRPKGDALYI